MPHNLPEWGDGSNIIPVTPFRIAKAYIVTSNRGKEYLVFAGSVEHQNAVLFNYTMRALYE